MVGDRELVSLSFPDYCERRPCVVWVVFLKQLLLEHVGVMNVGQASTNHKAFSSVYCSGKNTSGGITGLKKVSAHITSLRRIEKRMTTLV